MKKRIFVAGIHQESNSFSAALSTKENFFEYWTGEQLIENVSGVKELIEAGYEIVPGLYADAWPGGILKLEEFRKMVDTVLELLPMDGSIDGVFFPSHGALEVEFIGSGDTFLLSKIRERVGGNVPIAAALDLHANNTHTMGRITNIIYGYRTAPHIDIAETRIRTAMLLDRAIREGVLPWTEIIRIPFMTPGENMMTETGFGKEVIERVAELENVSGIWCASYFAGMPWVDCPHGGASIVISGVGDKKKALEETKKLGQEIWDRKNEFVFQGISMEPREALRALDQQEKSIAILSDSADNITAGASGDNAYMLNLIVEEKIQNILYAAIVDAPAVQLLAQKKIGEETDLVLGGSLSSKSQTVHLKAAKLLGVFYQEEKANAAVVRCGGLTVLIFAEREPVRSREELQKYDLNMDDYHILVVKQGYLTPELQNEAKVAIMALTPGDCAQKLTLLTYTNTRRPMEPLERVTDQKRILERYEETVE